MNSGAQYVALSGAFERDNFGDLLFGIVSEKLLHPIPVIRVGLHSRCLREFGSPPVYSARALSAIGNRLPPIALLCVGGEIFLADLKNAMAFNTPNEDHRLFSEMLPPRQERFAQLAANRQAGLAYVPWSDPTFALPDSTKILLNSCGGTMLSNTPASAELARTLLSRADFLSVRDSRTHSAIHDAVPSCHIAPDVVTLVARLCSSEITHAEKTITQQNDVFNGNYLLFQAKDRYLKQPSLAAEAITQISKSHALDVVLQPAGLASGHDSFEGMKKLEALIAAKLGDNRVHIQRDRNVYRQVAAIARSRIVIASSLHCRIVASAFARPRVSLSNGKVKSYIDTWESQLGMSTYTFDGLPAATNQALSIPHTTWVKLRDEQVSGADRNFALIRDLISDQHCGSFTPADMNELEQSLLLEETRYLRAGLLSLASESETWASKTIWKIKHRLGTMIQQAKRLTARS